MKKILSASLVLAFVVSQPASGQIWQHHTTRCPKTFTRSMGERAARAIYRGSRSATHRNLLMLGRIEMCQRDLHNQAFVRWYDHRQAHFNTKRREYVIMAAPATALASCIIQRESGGDPHAVNGQYEGIAQWSPSSWAGGGGLRYASTPLGASYGQQVRVLNYMLAHGQAGQWRPYDGC